MTTELRVRKVMETEFVCLSPADPIRRAIGALIDSGAAAAPVVEDDGTLSGILTQKDCFRPTLHASYYQEWRGTVGDHMSTNAVTIEASDDLVRAAELFLDHPYRVFPVVEAAKLVGMLDRRAVLVELFRTG
ncbi:MAG: CBS domain-containing protein [Silicimonas sp.]